MLHHCAVAEQKETVHRRPLEAQRHKMRVWIALLLVGSALLWAAEVRPTHKHSTAYLSAQGKPAAVMRYVHMKIVHKILQTVTGSVASRYANF